MSFGCAADLYFRENAVVQPQPAMSVLVQDTSEGKQQLGILRVFETCPLPVREEALRRKWQVVVNAEPSEKAETQNGASQTSTQQHQLQSKKKFQQQKSTGYSINRSKLLPHRKRNQVSVSPFVICWRNCRFTPTEFRLGHERGDRVNHFPHTKCLTKKDLLIRAMRKMRAVHGRIFDFVPAGFILPSEYTKFVQAYAEDDEAQKTLGEKNSQTVWICKPADLSRGRKIFLIKDLSELCYDQQYVIQRYVPNPMTIGGYKVDLRVYVLVTSMQPLRIHVFRNGLARFGTAKYDNNMQEIDNLFSHLTNSSINKLSQTYNTDKDVIGSGCKWDFASLRRWMNAPQNNNIFSDTSSSPAHFIQDRFATLWRRICDIAICTILTALQPGALSSSCFELFGFDILVDEALRPWLLEVNCAPALSIDCGIDRRVKEPLIRAMFDLVQASTSSASKSCSARKSTVRSMRRSWGFPSNASSTRKSQICPSVDERQEIDFNKSGSASHVVTAIETEAQEPVRHFGEEGGDKDTQENSAIDTEVKELSVFDCIFPFDETTSHAAQKIANVQGEGRQRVLSENVRTIIQQVKRRRRGATSSFLKEESESNVGARSRSMTTPVQTKNRDKLLTQTPREPLVRLVTPKRRASTPE